MYGTQRRFLPYLFHPLTFVQSLLYTKLGRKYLPDWWCVACLCVGYEASYEEDICGRSSSRHAAGDNTWLLYPVWRGEVVLPYSTGAVFCPHWLVVVGPTTTQPILTTTQPTLTTTNKVKELLIVTFHTLFAYNLTTTHVVLGRTLI